MHTLPAVRHLPCMRAKFPCSFGTTHRGEQGQGWGSPHERHVATSTGRQPPKGHSPASALVGRALPTFCDNFIQLLSSWSQGHKYSENKLPQGKTAALGGQSLP